MQSEGSSQRKTRPSTTTIHFVPLPRLVFPTPQPFFAGAKTPSRNDSLTSIAGARLTRSETFARFSTKRPAPPNLAVVASTSKMREFLRHVLPASPAPQNPQNPSSTRRFSIHGRHPCVVGRLGSKARSSATALRSATHPIGHRPSFGAADSPYLSSQKTQLPSFRTCTRLCNSF